MSEEERREKIERLRVKTLDALKLARELREDTTARGSEAIRDASNALVTAADCAREASEDMAS